jgi:hypothetical protein
LLDHPHGAAILGLNQLLRSISPPIISSFRLQNIIDSLRTKAYRETSGRRHPTVAVLLSAL